MTLDLFTVLWTLLIIGLLLLMWVTHLLGVSE